MTGREGGENSKFIKKKTKTPSRSVSQSAAQKTAREKNKKKARREEAFFIFSCAVFCAAP